MNSTCRDIANRNQKTMRTLDRALSCFSYDTDECCVNLRLDETTAENVKNGSLQPILRSLLFFMDGASVILNDEIGKEQE